MSEDLLSLLAQETALAAKVISSVSSDQLNGTTPCDDWDVRALIRHMCMGNHFVAECLRGNAVMPDYERDYVGDDHSSAYDRSRDDILQAATPDVLAKPVPFAGMEVPGQIAVTFALMEAIVHRWDVARAIGIDPQIDPDVAAQVLEGMRPMVVEDLRAASSGETTPTVPFGPPVDLPDSANGAKRLLAFTGRTP